MQDLITGAWAERNSSLHTQSRCRFTIITFASFGSLISAARGTRGSLPVGIRRVWHIVCGAQVDLGSRVGPNWFNAQTGDLVA